MLNDGTLTVALSDEQLDELAARIVARTSPTEEDRWLDSTQAAEYLGVHRDTFQKLAADGSIPTEQEGPGCKRYVKRSDLDAYRARGPRLAEVA